MNDEGLGEAADALAVDRSAREESGEFVVREEPNRAYERLRLGGVRHARHPAEGEAPQQVDAQRQWQELEQGKHEVGLHEKVAVGSLHKEAPAHAPDLPRHALLVVEVARVLEHRVREHDVERGIRDLGHVAPVAGDAREGRPGYGDALPVEEHDIDVVRRPESDAGPEGLGAAHVEDAQGARERRHERLEEREASASQRAGHAVAGGSERAEGSPHGSEIGLRSRRLEPESRHGAARWTPGHRSGNAARQRRP